jgi:hypothetical protein
MAKATLLQPRTSPLHSRAGGPRRFCGLIKFPLARGPTVCGQAGCGFRHPAFARIHMVYQSRDRKAGCSSGRSVGNVESRLSGSQRIILVSVMATAGLLAAGIAGATTRSNATHVPRASHHASAHRSARTHRPSPRSAHKLARIAEASRPSLPLPNRTRPHRHRGGRVVAMRAPSGHRDPRGRSSLDALTGAPEDRLKSTGTIIEAGPDPRMLSRSGDPRLARGPPSEMDLRPSLRARLPRASAERFVFAAPLLSRARPSAAPQNFNVTRGPSCLLHARRLEGAAACFEPPSIGGFTCPA